jgi:hypothetical protein
MPNAPEPSESEKALGLAPLEEGAGEEGDPTKKTPDAGPDDESADDADEDEDSEEEDESEDADEDDEDEDDDEDKDKGVEPESDPKKTVPLATYLDLKRDLDAVTNRLTNLESAGKMTADQKVVAEKVGEVAKAIAAKRGLDPDGLAEIMTEAIRLAIELTPKQRAELPEDVKNALGAIEKVQADAREKAETIHFEKEWNVTLSKLKKSYPNVDDARLKQAKELMDELSHSKKYHTFELDYILFKNRKKFDAILKGATKPKGGESSARGVVEDEEAGEVDFTDPDMTPDKLAKHDAKRGREATRRSDDTAPRFL